MEYNENKHMNSCSYIKLKQECQRAGKDVSHEKDLQNRRRLCKLRKQMEEAANKTTGVKHATVSFMTLKMTVEFEEGQDPKTVMQDVLKNCKKVEDDCEIFL